MLCAGVLSLLLCQFGEGRRIANFQKHEMQRREPEKKCQAQCGASSITMDGVEFTVGEGRKVSYERVDSECLSGCVVGKPGDPCGGSNPFLPTGLDKVSKNGKQKLCCKVEPCTWRVNLQANDGMEGSWDEMIEGETERLFPLQNFAEGKISRNTCFCCSEAGLPWNGNVNVKCKLAYGNHGDGIGFLQGTLSFLTFSGYDQFWKQGCEQYCRHFRGYTIAKKSMRAKVWVPAEVPIPIDGPKVAADLKEELDQYIEAAQAGLKHPPKSPAFDLNGLIDIGDEIREAIEQAEHEEVAPHMDAVVLQNAKDVLERLDMKTMPTQLMNAMVRIGDAMEAEKNGDLVTVANIREELEAVIARAEASRLQIPKIDQAKALLDAVDQILKDGSKSMHE